MMNLHRFFFGGGVALVTNLRHTESSRAMTPPPGIEVKSNTILSFTKTPFRFLNLQSLVMLFLLFFGKKKVQPSRRRQILFLSRFFISRFFPFLTMGNGSPLKSWAGEVPAGRSCFGGRETPTKSFPKCPPKVELCWKIQRHRQVQERGSGEWNSRQRILMPNSWLWVDFLIAFQEVRCSLHGLRWWRIHSWRFFLFCFVEATGQLNGSIGAGEIHGSKEFRNAKGWCTSFIICIYTQNQRDTSYKDLDLRSSHWFLHIPGCITAHARWTDCSCRISILPLPWGLAWAKQLAR